MSYHRSPRWSRSTRSLGRTLAEVYRNRRGKRAARRSGLTLIELMVSALLASLMMVALTHVVWSCAREAGQLRRDAQSRFPITQLAQQMRIDFANARGMLVDSQGITLHGFLGTDPFTHRPLLTPAPVRYEIAKIGQANVLIRSAATSREPVWFGLQSLRIEPLEQLDTESGNLPAAESAGLPAVPARFRISMVSDDGHLLWREVIHHDED